MTRRLELFAAEYDQLISFVHQQKKPVRVTCADEKERNRLAWRFYEYRRLLRESEDSLRQAFGREADYIMVHKEGNSIIFEDRRNSRESILLRQALNDAGANEILEVPRNRMADLNVLNPPLNPTQQLPQADTSNQDKAITDLYGGDNQEDLPLLNNKE